MGRRLRRRSTRRRSTRRRSTRRRSTRRRSMKGGSAVATLPPPSGEEKPVEGVHDDQFVYNRAAGQLDRAGLTTLLDNIEDQITDALKSGRGQWDIVKITFGWALWNFENGDHEKAAHLFNLVICEIHSARSGLKNRARLVGKSTVIALAPLLYLADAPLLASVLGLKFLWHGVKKIETVSNRVALRQAKKYFNMLKTKDLELYNAALRQGREVENSTVHQDQIHKLEEGWQDWVNRGAAHL